MLTREQQREILALGLLALALLVLLSLLPTEWLGPRGDDWFPSGNMVGMVGGAIRGLLGAFLGVTAYLVPALLTFGALRVGGWLSEDRMARLSLLSGGLLVLLPVFLWIVLADPAAAGWLGVHLGDPVMALMGWLGGLLLVVVAFAMLCTAALGWNPFRLVVRGALALTRALGAGAGRAAVWMRDAASALVFWLRAWVARRARSHEVDAERRDAEAVVEEVEGMGPQWLEEDPADDGGQGTPAESGTDTLDGAELDGDALVEATADVEGSVGVEEEEEDAEGEAGAAGPPEELLPPEEPDGAAAEFEVPPMELLSQPEGRDRATMERELDALGQVLVEKLRSFNVNCSLGARTTGPMVTRFEVIPDTGVKVNRIANLDADLALAMKAKSVRIVAPIPGKGAVGVEIPNPEPEIVHLREILESPQFRNAKGELPLALGKDLTGRPYVAHLEKMPHVLIAGATGSGKSVCLNTIVTSLVYRHTPQTLRLLMIDPKMVELSVYSRLPHLRHPVVTDPRDAAGVLKWAVLEMERRYALLKANHVRSIAEFNRKVRAGTPLRRAEPKGEEGDPDRWIYDDGVMPYIVVVVDELADLMMTVQSEVEKPLTQLAQKARAIGIHLIVATQRPSVNVITGLIKANFPTRIAFRVASKTDSRTILDMNGADALLGNGDMLFLPPGQSEPVRIQGAYLPTEDTERLMEWYVELLKRHGMEAVTDRGLETDILDELRDREQDEASGPDEIAGDWDELFRAAAEVCIQNGSGSTSLLQRRLSIGYGRAARIIDQLHDAGVLGPPDGSKGREVLMGLDELDAFLGGGGV